MASSQHLFGRAAEKHTIIVARGDRVRQFTLGSWAIRTASAFLLCGAVGCGAMAFWCVDGDDVVAANPSARPASSYELRIASLRAEVDRLTTRGYADRAKVSGKLDLLLDQQAALSDRYSKIQSVLDRARTSGLLPNAETASAPITVDDSNDLDHGLAEPLAYATPSERPIALQRFDALQNKGAAETDGASLADLIRTIGRSLDDADTTQAEGLDALTALAAKKSAAIGSVLRTEGIGNVVIPRSGTANEGGPLMPVTSREALDVDIGNLANALDTLQAVREASSALPIATPVSSTLVSSTFGVRTDPFLGRAAMHTGIDFVAGSGSKVQATAAGKVVFAGENGAYGNMVDVEHENGLTSRYAHLSEIAVSVGETVRLGTTVGRVGSTGRSTGPHLHYELRRAGNAIDPARFLRAGRRIEALG